MEQVFTDNPLLELLVRPAFIVKNDTIIQVNEAASQRAVTVGEPISKYVIQDLEAYHQFTEGCLFLTVTFFDLPCAAAVTKLDGCDLFLMDSVADGVRQSLALAAQQLRQPLNSVYSVVDDMKDRKQSAQLNQGLNQMHRIICNMSDLVRYDNRSALRMEPTDLCRVFDEVMEKAQTLLKKANYHLNYTALPQTVIGMADREMLERSVNNLISNAVKYSPKGSTLEAKLVSCGNSLRFTLQDPGEGIDRDIQKNLFFRYLREPAIEDSRHGLGLGLALVCSVAACHGGTVLVDRPENGGTRVTMTITVTPCDSTKLRSPVQMLIGDYAGGHDHTLVELSEVLPLKVYQK